MKIPTPTTVDFEAFGIGGRPHYPPVPVGVSIKEHGKKARYYAWGHPTKNNCTYNDAKKALQEAWKNPDGVLFHHGKFDADVAEVHMGLPFPKWQKIHDTLFLVFLDDPNQTELGLKPCADRLLDMPPEEQDAVAEWLVEHQPVNLGLSPAGKEIKIGKGAKSKQPAGKYIAFAPGDLVGRYANGDVIRTEKLFHLLYKTVRDREMIPSYDRERELMPILLDMERQGIRVDLKKLRSDVKMYDKTMGELDEWIFKRLKIDDPEFNLNSGPQLTNAIIAADKADEENWELTPTGQYRSTKDAISHGCTDKTLIAVLKYRTQLKTCLNTFMHSWLATAESSGGYIFTTWNQIKSSGAGGNVGTRTGRLSSTPNFQNIPKLFDVIFRDKKHPKLPACPFKKGLSKLPLVRSYIIPYEDGDVLIDRDYSQQEPRILAHFEGGSLMEQYQADPWIDYHDNAKFHLEQILGRKFERKPVKNINLGIIYGQGVGSLAEKNESTVDETKQLKKEILGLYPGLNAMYKDMKMRAKNHLPIRTWGGREYYCEEPKIVKGRMMHFDYKMVNTLIQGSAGDCTKQAMIDYYKAKPKHHRLMLQVHDQLTASVPKKDVKSGMEIMRTEMEKVEFDVLILSEGSTSSTNWAELKDYDVKGKLI